MGSHETEYESDQREIIPILLNLTEQDLGASHCSVGKRPKHLSLCNVDFLSVETAVGDLSFYSHAGATCWFLSNPVDHSLVLDNVLLRSAGTLRI